MNHSSRTNKKVVFCIIAPIVFCSVFFSWCTQQLPKEQPISKQIQHVWREAYRVALSVYTDTPFDTNTPTKVIWYGWVYAENLIRTAKHLLTNNTSRLVITTHTWTICPVQHIWMHDYQDIALIQTSTSCVPWISRSTLFDDVYPKEVLYINNTLKKTSLTFEEQWSVLIKEQLSPWMSWSPLFLVDRTVIGIISAQTTNGTEVVVIDKKLLATRPVVAPAISWTE